MEGAYRILIVEDSEIGRRLLTEMLAGGPYALEAVGDAEAALAVLADRTCHLVITDVNLPGMSGLDLLEHLRLHHPRLPVILVTAHASIETAVQALRLGASNFLQKPFSMADIQEIVRKSLRPWAINAGMRATIPEVTKRISMQLLSSTEVIDPVFYHVYSDALSLGFPERVLRLNVYLALNEALANAVRHGNRGDPTKRVRVEVRLTPAEIEVEIQDEGDGFDPGELPDPTAADNLLKTSGRGVFLMRCYMDQVEYRDQGRTVVLRKFADSEGLRAELPAEPEVAAPGAAPD